MLNYTYLAQKADYENFAPNDLARFDYLGVFNFGGYAEKIGRFEKAQILTDLASQWKDRCLFVSAQALAETPNDSFLKTLCEPFASMDNRTAFVGLMTHRRGVDDALLHRPVFRTVKVSDQKNPGHVYYDAFATTIEELLRTRSQNYLDTVKIEPSNRSLVTVIPNGKRIQKLEDSIPPSRRSGYKSADKTVQRAKSYTPVSRPSVAEIAAVLGTTVEELIFEDVVVNRRGLLETRLQTQLSAEALSQRLDANSPKLFDHLETGASVRAEVMCAVHRELEKLLNTTVKMSELLDIPATEDIAEKNSQKVPNCP